MSELTLFSKEVMASDLFKALQSVNENLMGGEAKSTTRRISIKGGKFRQMVNGEQISVSKDNEMNIIIVDAAPISRTYYEGAYDPNKVAAPTCWSGDTRAKKPAADVPEDQRQAVSCDNCPQSIKGSGVGNSRACRFGQRLAVALEGDLSTIYQLQLPATSIFGDTDGDKMPMQAFVRKLAAHKMPAAAIVTTMYFDDEAEVPKLYFKPARPLSEEELAQVLEAKETEDCKRAVTLTVAQTDKVIATDAPKVAAKPKPSLFDNKPESVEADDIAEPKVVNKKPKMEADSGMSDLIDQWDD